MGGRKGKFVKDITPIDEDFARWYTDVVMKTDLADYTPIKGFMVIKPYGYAIWENIKNWLDQQLKATGHENVYFPLLIPESLLKKEAEHVEGFAPEVAWVTHGGDHKLSERLCIRPTSETLICSMFAKWLSSYKELPYLYNQWGNVVRWEKSTRPFLRTSEFLWQEGHTLHVTKEEAQQETMKILSIYQELAEQVLAMPVVTGLKTEKEKFAGAEATYTMEALMHDGKALQSGTSHYLGQHFTKAFEITYLDRNSHLQNPFHTSWGVSTRLIGGLIMTHGDSRGLKLPPAIAPLQVVIVPIAQHKDARVMETAVMLQEQLGGDIRSKIDAREDYSPGWKFNEWEMKGVPLRIEIGPRDIDQNQITLCRRDTLEKRNVAISTARSAIVAILDDIQKEMLAIAKDKRHERTTKAYSYKEAQEVLLNQTGFVKMMWCGERDCEDKIKQDTGASIRCIPFSQEQLTDHCPICGKPATSMVYLAKAY